MFSRRQVIDPDHRKTDPAPKRVVKTVREWDSAIRNELADDAVSPTGFGTLERDFRIPDPDAYVHAHTWEEIAVLDCQRAAHYFNPAVRRQINETEEDMRKDARWRRVVRSWSGFTFRLRSRHRAVACGFKVDTPVVPYGPVVPPDMVLTHDDSPSAASSRSDISIFSYHSTTSQVGPTDSSADTRRFGLLLFYLFAIGRSLVGSVASAVLVTLVGLLTYEVAWLLSYPLAPFWWLSVYSADCVSAVAAHSFEWLISAHTLWYVCFVFMSLWPLFFLVGVWLNTDVTRERWTQYRISRGSRWVCDPSTGIYRPIGSSWSGQHYRRHTRLFDIVELDCVSRLYHNLRRLMGWAEEWCPEEFVDALEAPLRPLKRQASATYARWRYRRTGAVHDLMGPDGTVGPEDPFGNMVLTYVESPAKNALVGSLMLLDFGCMVGGWTIGNNLASYQYLKHIGLDQIVHKDISKIDSTGFGAPSAPPEKNSLRWAEIVPYFIGKDEKTGEFYRRKDKCRVAPGYLVNVDLQLRPGVEDSIALMTSPDGLTTGEINRQVYRKETYCHSGSWIFNVVKWLYSTDTFVAGASTKHRLGFSLSPDTTSMCYQRACIRFTNMCVCISDKVLRPVVLLAPRALKNYRNEVIQMGRLSDIDTDAGNDDPDDDAPSENDEGMQRRKRIRRKRPPGTPKNGGDPSGSDGSDGGGDSPSGSPGGGAAAGASGGGSAAPAKEDGASPAEPASGGNVGSGAGVAGGSAVDGEDSPSRHESVRLKALRLQTFFDGSDSFGAPKPYARCDFSLQAGFLEKEWDSTRRGDTYSSASTTVPDDDVDPFSDDEDPPVAIPPSPEEAVPTKNTLNLSKEQIDVAHAWTATHTLSPIYRALRQRCTREKGHRFYAANLVLVTFVITDFVQTVNEVTGPKISFEQVLRVPFSMFICMDHSKGFNQFLLSLRLVKYLTWATVTESGNRLLYWPVRLFLGLLFGPAIYQAAGDATFGVLEVPGPQACTRLTSSCHEYVKVIRHADDQTDAVERTLAVFETAFQGLKVDTGYSEQEPEKRAKDKTLLRSDRKKILRAALRPRDTARYRVTDPSEWSANAEYIGPVDAEDEFVSQELFTGESLWRSSSPVVFPTEHDVWV